MRAPGRGEAAVIGVHDVRWASAVAGRRCSARCGPGPQTSCELYLSERIPRGSYPSAGLHRRGTQALGRQVQDRQPCVEQYEEGSLEITTLGTSPHQPVVPIRVRPERSQRPLVPSMPSMLVPGGALGSSVHLVDVEPLNRRAVGADPREDRYSQRRPTCFRVGAGLVNQTHVGPAAESAGMYEPNRPEERRLGSVA